MLYLGTASRKIIDTFLSIFHDTFQIELAQIDETEMTWNIFKTIENLPSVKFAKSTNKDDCPAGRDFLTWLWYFSEEKGGKLNCKEYGTFEIMIEGPLVFAKSDESEGSRETVVRKDNPLRSAEAKAALTVGKKLKKAKIWLVRGKEAWKCTLDADSFNFTGLTLPEGEKLDDNGSVFAERVNFLHIFQNAIREYFAAFALCLKDPEWPKEQERIIAWEDERHTC
jgi:recombination associated protein RdgC